MWKKHLDKRDHNVASTVGRPTQYSKIIIRGILIIIIIYDCSFYARRYTFHCHYYITIY